MILDRIDHIVLTVRDLDRTLAFYEIGLGMQRIQFGDNRVALQFGQQKINLHQLGNEFEPKAGTVASGSADLCLILKTPLSDAIAHLHQCGIAIIAGPISRTGALGPITSIYIRDPDDNLIELATYEPHPVEEKPGTIDGGKLYSLPS